MRRSPMKQALFAIVGGGFALSSTLAGCAADGAQGVTNPPSISALGDGVDPGNAPDNGDGSEGAPAATTCTSNTDCDGLECIEVSQRDPTTGLPTATTACEQICEVAPGIDTQGAALHPRPCARGATCLLIQPGLGECFDLCTTSADCASSFHCQPIVTGTSGPSACALDEEVPTGSPGIGRAGRLPITIDR